MNIKTYSYEKDKDVKLSEHFKVGECRSKDGSDKILVDTNLAFIAEKVRKHFNCKYIKIISAYRTPEHDKKVGGSGKGYHTTGQAWDINSRDINGNTIDAKYICCFLQDIGVKGIGYVNKNSVHIDTRENKYWFDETNDNRSIGNDFYSYFNVKKEEIYKEESINNGELQDSIEESNPPIKENDETNEAYKFKYICKKSGYKKIYMEENEIMIIK